MAQDEPEGSRDFTEWASARQPSLLRTAFLLCGDQDRADDLVQEALVKVALRWQRLRVGSPDAYARQVMVRTNVSWWRNLRRESRLGQQQVPPNHTDRDVVERRLVFLRALRRLTPKQRAVLVLRYYNDLTEADTADALGVSVGTVKSQTRVALQRLRQGAPELVEFIGGGAQ